MLFCKLLIHFSIVALAPGATIPVSNLGYSYTTSISVSGVEYTEAVLASFLSSTYVTNAAHYGDTICEAISVDSTLVYLEADSAPCALTSAELSVHDIATDTEILLYGNITAQNPILHDWEDSSNGFLGLNYNTSGGDTPFLSVLRASAASDEAIFGLDLQPQESGIPSSMQLSYILSNYSDSLVWGDSQATVYPSSHQFFASQLSFCGTSILTNWSSNWPVIVDTASSCLTLPSELYDVFSVYFDPTVELNEEAAKGTFNRLFPPLTFTFTSPRDVNSASATFSIFLEHLVLNSSAVLNEAGPIPLQSPSGANAGQSLCVIRGANIRSDDSNDFSTPPIIFGALVLRSLYFAADFNRRSVGFAQKPFNSTSSASEAQLAAGRCVPRAVCVGDQRYDVGTNTCNDAECARYFFVTYDSSAGSFNI
jgi:hypothetical protein